MPENGTMSISSKRPEERTARGFVVAARKCFSLATNGRESGMETKVRLSSPVWGP